MKIFTKNKQSNFRGKAKNLENQKIAKIYSLSERGDQILYV